MQDFLTVSQVNSHIAALIGSDPRLADIGIKGEISNFKDHYSGHMYFTLKDEKCTIKCVMFRGQNRYLKFSPENGMGVLARGYISVFERDGQYQLYVEQMEPDGIGSLYEAFIKQKERLMKEGLFDGEHKLPLPFLPGSIGIVTSKTGSVIRDIINVAKRRYPNVNIKLIPAQVQGERAALSVAAGIRKFNELNNVDVIIVARGGGSIEDLWPFNEEIVARAAFESRIPVVSAVGHETDFTIIDFVADLRAPTPSAGAELVVPVKRELQVHLEGLKNRAIMGLGNNLRHKRAVFTALRDSFVLKQPYNRVNQERLRVDNLTRNLNYFIKAVLSGKREKLSSLGVKLAALNPREVLKRGYSIVTINDRILRNTSDAKMGDRALINVTDGIVETSVKGVVKSNG